MSASDPLLARLRQGPDPADDPVRTEMGLMGLSLVAEGGPLEERWHQAVAELAGCVRPVGDSPGPILTEGGNYPGAWIESTGTISTQVLDRFAPAVSQRTHLEFARHCREDGLMPYKLTDEGPGFGQIQIVTPLARSVWRHQRLTRAGEGYLGAMYQAMSRMDAWLAAHRDTRGTGGVEAFCAFDTGHDNSPRFWFLPDRCPGGDASRWDPAATALPLVAPDLTANLACQRRYLGLIAAELGEDPAAWSARAEASLTALWAQCFNPEDDCFYDRAADGSPVRLVGDVLPRVLDCEVGDEALFSRVLERYLMNTRQLLAPAGWTSLSLSDPRFDHDHTRNSWGGPVNFLTMMRNPDAFEHQGHLAELALVESHCLAAMLATDRFPQCLDPWSGRPGFTDHYSPAILWLLDAVERNTGILPRPDGTVWFTGGAPLRWGAGQESGRVGYARTVAVPAALAANPKWISILVEAAEPPSVMFSSPTPASPMRSGPETRSAAPLLTALPRASGLMESQFPRRSVPPVTTVAPV